MYSLQLNQSLIHDFSILQCRVAISRHSCHCAPNVTSSQGIPCDGSCYQRHPPDPVGAGSFHCHAGLLRDQEDDLLARACPRLSSLTAVGCASNQRWQFLARCLEQQSAKDMQRWIDREVFAMNKHNVRLRNRGTHSWAALLGNRWHHSLE